MTKQQNQTDTKYDPWVCLSCQYKNHKVKLAWDEKEETHICPCCGYKQDMLCSEPILGISVPCTCTYDEQKEKSLARFLAYRLVNRDYFTVNGGELTGKDKENYEAIVVYFEHSIRQGIEMYISDAQRSLVTILEELKADLLKEPESDIEGESINTLQDVCWICLNKGADSKVEVHVNMPGGNKCPAHAVPVHNSCFEEWAGVKA